MSTSSHELIFRVSADTKHLGNPLAVFQRDIEKTTKELEVLQSELDEIDGETVHVDIDADAEKVAAAVALARREIQRLKEEVADKFVIDPTVDTRRAERTISALRAKIKALSDEGKPGPDPEQVWSALAENMFALAARSGVQFVSFFARSIQNTGPQGGALIGSALAVVMGSAISVAAAALVGGVGLTAMTAGIVAALQDPSIMAQAKETVGQIESAFLGLGHNLKAPFLSGFADVGQSIEDVFADLAPEFARLGGLIEFFGQQIALTLRALGPGIASALEAAGPVLTQLGMELPRIARAISGFFGVINQHADGAALAMKLFLMSIESTILGLTLLTSMALMPFTLLMKGARFANQEFMEMESNLRKMFVFMGGGLPFALANKLADLGDASDESTKKLDKFKKTEEEIAAEAAAAAAEQQKLAAAFEKVRAEAEQATQALAGYFSEMFSGTMGLDRAIISVEDGWTKLNDALKDGERSLKLNTQAGRDNRTAILDQLQALSAEREARVTMGDSILDANAGFLAGIAAIRANTDELGFNAAEVDNLLAKYEAIPAQQIIEIQTEWSTSANPDVAYAELVKKFGQPVVQKILAGVDHESTRIAKEFFGTEFGDPISMRNFAKIDPEGLAQMKADIAAVMGKDPENIKVNMTVVKDATFEAINTQLDTWDKAKPSPYVVPQIEPEAYGAVLTTLFDLQKARTVPIVPYVDPTAAEAVRIALANLAAGATIRPSTNTGGSDIDRTRPGTNAQAISVRPRIYIDGNEIRAVIRGEVTDSVGRSTVAATRYRRLA